LRRLLLFISVVVVPVSIMAQKERVKNQPYADFKMFHLGFHLGFHTQDLILTNTGYSENGEVWFAEVPSYSPGFSVGVIGDMFLNPYMNLRLTPTIHFGDKTVTFIEHNTKKTFSTSLRSNILVLPLSIKYSAFRLNNYRPYVVGGVYAAFDLGRKKNAPLLLGRSDYGLEVGLGCDFYLPYFKLCPELKFGFGLADVLEKKRPDLTNRELIKYTDALSKVQNRMITLIFNFE
jgi:hypothetical protein